jgi:hypothetical protein
MDESQFQAGWRIVATLPAGTPLIAGVDALCTRHEIADAEIRLSGAVRDASVSLGDDAEAILLPGVSQLIVGQGHLVPDLGVTGFSAVLAWSDRGQPRVLAGFVESAVSAGIRVVIESFDPAQAPTRAVGPAAARPAARTVPPASGPARPSVESPKPGVAPTSRPQPHPTPTDSAGQGAAAGKPAPPAASPAPVASGWGAAVAASKAAPPPTQTARPGQPALTSNGAGPLDEDPDPKPGDILVHPQFGRCKSMSNADNDRVKIRTATGRFVDLHLGYVRLVRQADEDGHRVFRVQPTKR